MQDAFFSRLVKAFGRQADCLARGFHVTLLNSQPGFLDGFARRTTVNAVADTAFFVLTITFDLRFYVSQNILRVITVQ